jgi:hypothetical protein
VGGRLLLYRVDPWMSASTAVISYPKSGRTRLRMTGPNCRAQYRRRTLPLRLSCPRRRRRTRGEGPLEAIELGRFHV